MKSRKRTGTLEARLNSCPHTKFKGQVYVLRRKGEPTILQWIQTQFYLRDNRRNRRSKATRGTEDVHAWNNVVMEIGRITPVAIEEDYVSLSERGGRTVGSGSYRSHRVIIDTVIPPDN